MRKGILAAVTAATLAAGAAERIIHCDEMDHLANRTAAFNKGAGACETRCGITGLSFATDVKGTDLHKTFFRFAESPKAKSWTVLFKFRPTGAEPRAFGLKLYFGDRDKPETKLLTIAETGSFFEGGAKPPAPKDGDPGFFFGHGEAGFGAWQRGAITVSGTEATFWTYRGGKLVAEAKGTVPAKPLVGWNLTATAEKTRVSFDRMMLVDGVSRPYERGDLTEVIAELAKKPLGAWDAAFGGAPVAAGAPVAFLGTVTEFQFRSPFEKGEKVAFEFRAADGKSETVTFAVGNHSGETSYRTWKDGKFVDKGRKAVATNGVLTVSGTRSGYLAVPPLGGQEAYETPEIAEIAAARDVFAKPNGRAYRLAVVPETGGQPVYRLLLDGQLFRTLAFAQPLKEIVVSGKGIEAQSRSAQAPAPKGPETWPLNLPAGGFKLERCRENLGSYALECNEYLSRDALKWMPSSCLWNVPRKQWYRAKARCTVDPTAPAEFVPVITARLTHFCPGSGRSEAVVETTVDLSKEDPRVVKQGDVYDVTFDLDVASIMDLTSMTDGLTHKVLDRLHFEFLGPVWEKNRYYIDSRRAPAEELRSSVIVLGGSLEESPVWMKVEAGRPYALYYPGETPTAKVTLTNLTDKSYVFSAEAFGESGASAGKTTFAVKGPVAKEVAFPKDGPFGHYRVVYTVADEKGGVIQRFNASYGLLPADDRKAGYESPYYSWNFNGSHGTVGNPKDWLPSYKYLGFHRTMMPGKSWETNELYAAYKVTHAEVPYIPVRGTDGQAMEAAKAQMRDYMKRFPHCRQALIFHESGGGPFPKEVYGGKTELNDWVLRHQSNRVEQAIRTAKCWREVDPNVQLIIGNSAESYGLVAELMRGGFPKEYCDAWGEESVGLTMAPEMSTAFTPWIIRKTARIYGYPERMNAPWEWKNRTERYERSWRGAAALNIRDGLISHALGYTTIPLEIGCEVANSYADTIWHVQTFTRWPLAYPAENAVAIATLTRVLDCAKFVRQVPTGSLTAYALEFKGKDGKWIYAIWTARGETTAKIAREGGRAYLHIGMTGAETKTDSPTVEFLDEPGYIVADGKIDSFAVAPKRTFRHENAASLAKNRVVVALAKAAEVELDPGEDVRMDPKFDDMPFRPGRFAVRDADDAEKGACIEVEHLSQEACPEIMQEYCHLRLREPIAIEKPFDTIGVWAKGNSNWGKVAFEITDAEGEKWYSSGIGGIGCYVYDWPGKLSFNYDGWNFLQVPFTPKSEVRIVGPGENHWMWTRDATGNGKVDWPVRVTAIGISQFGRTLDLIDMKKGSPVIRLAGLSVR